MGFLALGVREESKRGVFVVGCLWCVGMLMFVGLFVCYVLPSLRLSFLLFEFFSIFCLGYARGVMKQDGTARSSENPLLLYVT